MLEERGRRRKEVTILEENEEFKDRREDGDEEYIKTKNAYNMIQSKKIDPFLATSNTFFYFLRVLNNMQCTFLSP